MPTTANQTNGVRLAPVGRDYPMSSQDALWLTMDRPNNLMVIDSLMWFRSPVSKAKLRAVLQERLLRRFPTFTCRAVQVDGEWLWREQSDFDIDTCFTSIRAPKGEGVHGLRRIVAEARSTPLPRDRPLWSITLVTQLTLDDGSMGSAVIVRAHHSLADGVRLTQVMLGLCDTSTEATPVDVGKKLRRHTTPAGIALSAAQNITLGTVDSARSAGNSLLRAATTIPTQGVGAVRSAGASLAATVRNPGRLSSLASAFGSTDNRVVNDVAAVAKLTLSAPSVRTVWSGTPGIEKTADWAPTFDLNEVKAIGKATGTTVNDVLLGTVSGALTRYLREHGDAEIDELLWMVPVSVRPLDPAGVAGVDPDESAPTNNLGNYFALVALRMPIGIDDVRERLSVVHNEMLRIKTSDEALLTFGVQRAISNLPTPVAVGLTNFFANKGVGVLTNVPGPRDPLVLAGTEVAGILAWAPCSGDQVMTICIFSYNGRVSVGFGTDASLIPDVDRLAALLGEEFEQLRQQVLGDRTEG